MPLPDALALPELAPAVLVAAVFLVAGIVKGVVGLGLPTVAMALLALMMTPAEAAALLIVPSLVTNVWQTRPWGSLKPLLERLGPMQWGVGVGTLGGAWILGAPAGAWATVCLGVALIGYAAWGLAGARVRLDIRAETRLGFPAGATTGLLTAATGVFVIPAVPYLQALGMQRDELVQAMGLSFTVSTLALAGGLAMNDRYPAALLGMSFVMLLPALIGMGVGQYLRRRLSQARFRQCFFGSLILLGLHLVWR